MKRVAVSKGAAQISKTTPLSSYEFPSIWGGLTRVVKGVECRST